METYKAIAEDTNSLHPHITAVAAESDDGPQNMNASTGGASSSSVTPTPRPADLPLATLTSSQQTTIKAQQEEETSSATSTHAHTIDEHSTTNIRTNNPNTAPVSHDGSDDGYRSCSERTSVHSRVSSVSTEWHTTPGTRARESGHAWHGPESLTATCSSALREHTACEDAPVVSISCATDSGQTTQPETPVVYTMGPHSSHRGGNCLTHAKSANAVMRDAPPSQPELIHSLSAVLSDDPLSLSFPLQRQRTSQLSMELSSSSSAVGGHHITLTQGATFLKQSGSRREESFYTAIQPAQDVLVDTAVRHTPQIIRAWKRHLVRLTSTRGDDGEDDNDNDDDKEDGENDIALSCSSASMPSLTSDAVLADVHNNGEGDTVDPAPAATEMASTETAAQDAAQERWSRGYKRLLLMDAAAAEAALPSQSPYTGSLHGSPDVMGVCCSPRFPATASSRVQPNRMTSSPTCVVTEKRDLLSPDLTATSMTNTSTPGDRWLSSPVQVPSSRSDGREAHADVEGSPRSLCAWAHDAVSQPHQQEHESVGVGSLTVREQCLVRLAASMWWLVPTLTGSNDITSRSATAQHTRATQDEAATTTTTTTITSLVEVYPSAVSATDEGPESCSAAASATSASAHGAVRGGGSSSVATTAGTSMCTRSAEHSTASDHDPSMRTAPPTPHVSAPPPVMETVAVATASATAFPDVITVRRNGTPPRHRRDAARRRCLGGATPVVEEESQEQKKKEVENEEKEEETGAQSTVTCDAKRTAVAAENCTLSTQDGDDALALLAPFVPRFFGLRHLPYRAVNRAAAMQDTALPAGRFASATPSFLVDAMASHTHTNKKTNATAATAAAAVGADGAGGAVDTGAPSSPHAIHHTDSPHPCDADAYDEDEEAHAQAPLPEKPTSSPQTQTRHDVASDESVHTAAVSAKNSSEVPALVRSPRDVTVRMVTLEDVCFGLQHPCVLDVKMGTRQFGLNPSEAKRKSKEKKAAQSTSAQYGIRLAGFRLWDDATQDYIQKTKLQCRSLGIHELHTDVHSFLRHDPLLRRTFRDQVVQLERAFAHQLAYRFYTSSLLFVYDAAHPTETCRIVMVDFAYAYHVSELVRERDPDAGHLRDEGYLRGLHTLLGILAEPDEQS